MGLDPSHVPREHRAKSEREEIDARKARRIHPDAVPAPLRGIVAALEGERGQGTVEYVGLILLVSLLMIGMVAAMKGFNGRQGTELADLIVQTIAKRGQAAVDLVVNTLLLPSVMPVSPIQTIAKLRLVPDAFDHAGLSELRKVVLGKIKIQGNSSSQVATHGLVVLSPKDTREM